MLMIDVLQSLSIALALGRTCRAAGRAGVHTCMHVSVCGACGAGQAGRTCEWCDLDGMPAAGSAGEAGGAGNAGRPDGAGEAG